MFLKLIWKIFIVVYGLMKKKWLQPFGHTGNVVSGSSNGLTSMRIVGSNPSLSYEEKKKGR